MSLDERRLSLKVGEETITISLKRHLSPEIVNSIARLAPKDTFAFRKGDVLYVRTDLKKGGKGRDQNFAAGDVIYDVQQRAVGIVLADTEARRHQVKVGRCMDDLTEISGLRGVSSSSLRLVEDSEPTS